METQVMERVIKGMDRLDTRLTELENKSSVATSTKSSTESSASEAILQDMQDELTRRGDEIARLTELYQRLGRQVSTPEGFAELADAAHLFQGDESDVDFINFARAIGKGHLVRYLTEEEGQASLKEMAQVSKADELRLIGEALEREEAKEKAAEEAELKSIADALKNEN